MAELTEHRQRFEAARKDLRWSLSKTVMEIQTTKKNLESWLYQGGRDVPLLAVLLMEARRDLARQPKAHQSKPTTRPKEPPRNSERDQQIIAAVDAGEPISSLAKRMNLTRARIHQIMTKAGKRRVRKSLSGEEREQLGRDAVAALIGGETVKSFAAKNFLPTGLVRKLVSEQGLSMRDIKSAHAVRQLGL